MRESVETERGPIEVERAGEGPAVLFVHGTPGGADSSMAMGRFLTDAGFELIAPSRPGYLGTRLDGRETIDAQADLLAALLEALGHASVGVITWSGGGPSGYRLAVRHPGRVTALVPFAAVSHGYPEPKSGLDERLMLNTSFGNWLLRFLAAHAPRETVKATLAAEGDLSEKQLEERVAGVLGDERKLDVVLTMARACADHRHRAAGVENDWKQFGASDSLELERIAAPTLVINGDVDTDVPPEHSEFAARTIAGADHLVLESGTHLALFVHPKAEAAQARVIELFQQS